MNLILISRSILNINLIHYFMIIVVNFNFSLLMNSKHYFKKIILVDLKHYFQRLIINLKHYFQRLIIIIIIYFYFLITI